MRVLNYKILDAILHVTEEGIDIPVLSDKTIDFNEDNKVYINKVFEKTINSPNIKKGRFKSKINGFRDLMSNLNKDNFIDTTKLIAKTLSDFYNRNPSIPNGDLLFLFLKDNENKSYFSMIKLNHKSAYLRVVNGSDDIWDVQIQKNIRVFQEASKSADEFIFIDLENEEFKIVEKSYVIDGKRSVYLSENLLKEDVSLNKKTVIKEIQSKINEEVKSYVGVIESSIVQDLIMESINNDEDNIAEIINKYDLPSELNNSINKAIEDSQFKISELKTKPKGKVNKHKIITESGIEISIPIDILEKKEGIELITNANGTLSIRINNIEIK